MRTPARDSVALLRSYLLPQIWLVLGLVVLVLAGIGAQIGNPLIVRAFIDAVTARRTGSDLLTLAGLFIFVALLQQVLAVLSTWVGERLGWATTNAMREDLLLHCLGLDLSFHKARTPGEMIERIDGDVTALANFFSRFLIQVMGSALLMVGVLAVLWTMDGRVGLALTVFGLVLLAVMVRLRSLALPHWKAARQASADLFGFIEERLAGLVDIRSSGARDYVMRRLYVHLRERLRTGGRARVMGTVSWAVPVVGFGIGNVLALGLAAWLYTTRQMGIGTAFLIYYYTQLLFQPINMLSNQMEDFQRASAGIARILELLRLRSALVEEESPSPLPSGALPLELRDVDFGYEAEEVILHRLSVRVPAGRVLGILGRTGSGKTTVTRLVARLYDPQAGSVLLGGVELRRAPLRQVRERVAVVTQDVQLFRATVRDNLTLFDTGIPDQEILGALRGLGLEDWLSTLPRGLDTMLAAGGGGLSAGEAQLLALARAFLRDPGLVVLDEASSRVDPRTEALIERAVDALLDHRTGIVVAHRLGTVGRADDILILAGGEKLEHGGREDLARDPESVFSHLLRVGMEEALA